MEERVREFIESNRLILRGDRVLVAVSGGADSMALLQLLFTLQDPLGCEIGAAHLNHAMRGAAGDQDEAFVADFCKARGIPFYCRRTAVRDLARELKIGEEEAGRRARYAFFETVMNQQGYDKLATAHHRDDQAETVLMRLIRGTGVAGAAGIPAKKGAVIRPLLCVDRAWTEDYCTAVGIAWRTDCTNDDQAFTRNVLRSEVMPRLREINPQSAAHLAAFAGVAGEYEAFVEECIRSRAAEVFTTVPEGLSLDLAGWQAEPKLIRTGLIRWGIAGGCGSLVDVGRQHVEALTALMADNPGPWDYPLPRGGWVCRRYNTVAFLKKAPRPPQTDAVTAVLTVPGRVEIGGEAFTTAVLRAKDLNISQKTKINSEIYIDYGKIKKHINLRTRKAGDYICLRGMTGRKKLKDYFIDRKIVREARSRMLLLAVGNEVLWIPGYDVNCRYMPDGETEIVLKVVWEKVSEREY
jgi:tRNA(Ile)-lysidine synthase